MNPGGRVLHWKDLFRAGGGLYYGSAKAYGKHLRKQLREHPNNRPLAFARAVGAEDLEGFVRQGDIHVDVLRYHGLADGMAVYDLGCGSGRTAQALQRSGWQGRYTGADIVPGFVKEMCRSCPGYAGKVHLDPSIVAEDHALDMVFHWSVFTHITVEECFLYMQDTFRALKPGGTLVFSFLEIGHLRHEHVFDSRVARRARGKQLALLDTFLHPDWIRHWAARIGFEPPAFTSGEDGTHHPPFWQSLVAMRKPL